MCGGVAENRLTTLRTSKIPSDNDKIKKFPTGVQHHATER
jgi:hypothetical protein